MAFVPDIFKTILDHLEVISRAETVLGEPVTIGEKTVIPVVKMSLGFGAGGNDVSGEKQTVSGGGGGGGVSINPVGFIVMEGDKTAFLPVKAKSVSALTEMIPNIIEKITSMKKEKEEPNPE